MGSMVILAGNISSYTYTITREKLMMMMIITTRLETTHGIIIFIVVIKIRILNAFWKNQRETENQG